MVDLMFSDGKHCYMDNHLYEELKRLRKTLEADDDCVLIVDGVERCGKSVFTQQISRAFDNSFTEVRMCVNEEDFSKAIDEAKKYQAVVFDESNRALSSEDWASRIAKILRSKMMEMGQKNLLVIIVHPNFFLLHKYIVLHRARGLFHVYRKGPQRGFWIYFDAQRMRRLYIMGKKNLSYSGKMFPHANCFGRFYNQYVIDEKAYRKKKEESLKENEVTAIKTGKEELPEHLRERRDAIILKMKQEGFKYQQIRNELVSQGFKRYNVDALSKIYRDLI